RAPAGTPRRRSSARRPARARGEPGPAFREHSVRRTRRTCRVHREMFSLTASLDGPALFSGVADEVFDRGRILDAGRGLDPACRIDAERSKARDPISDVSWCQPTGKNRSGKVEPVEHGLVDRPTAPAAAAVIDEQPVAAALRCEQAVAYRERGRDGL